MLRDIFTIARKELAGFFNSLAAFLFLGAFLGVCLFVFFWVDTFFARNLADVRPLFQWMPVLLIFLVAALTMRSWAEERRAGTLELLLTAPVSATRQVLGKFAGALGLVAIALAFTLPLPFTVAWLGPLDWGPVVGGYVAAMALASSYVAIGLWVSSRTDNQIVSLILTTVIAGVFYLIGASALTALVGQRVGDVLRELGAGSRFNSITRGVLDLRDIYYYLSITATFLVLNRLSVEKMRWAGNTAQVQHRRWYWVAGLLAANLLVANLWLHQVRSVRVDLTEGRLYTLSDSTQDYLNQLHEPLLIRGYFSAATHPLLAPLVPQLRDLLEEYAVAGGANVRVEFVDPRDDIKLEEEASSRYGIRPVPFQTTSKYQASVVNSYFDVLVSYGDEYKVLGFRDLIDVKARAEGDFDVVLKNPEYDITRTIRKVLMSYQGDGNAFSVLKQPLTFTGYLSNSRALPEILKQARQALDKSLAQLRLSAGDMLQVQFKDPDADPALAKQLTEGEGLRPLMTSLLDPRPFWFHLSLSDGKLTEQVPMPQTLDEEGFKRSLEAAVKRFSAGFLKTVAVYTPPAPRPPQGYPSGSGPKFNTLREALSTSVRWLDADLRDGQIPAEADMLMVLGPEGLDEQQVFAIDQFLMLGGSVVIATAPTQVTIGQGVAARPLKSGLEDWLAGHGLSLGKGLVLDPRSGALPIPVERRLGAGLSVREIQLVPYPYIVDIRDDGLDTGSPVTASLGQLHVPFAAPISVNAEKNKFRKLTTFLRSSDDSWTSDNTSLVPDYNRHTDVGFARGETRGAQPIAVMLEGRFDSSFKGLASPLLKPAQDAPEDDGSNEPTPSNASSIGRVIDHSRASARLVLVGSNAVFGDQAMQLVGQAMGNRSLKAAEFAQNLVDWSLQDQGLLGIRSRGHFARTLAPLTRDKQGAWEYANYGVVLAGLALLWLFNRRRRSVAARRYAKLLQEG